MGRPKGVKNKQKEHEEIVFGRKTIRNYFPKKVCACCKKQITSTNFYKSLNPLASDHLSDFCKDCTIDFCLDEKGNVDSDKLRTICQQLNRPFITTVLDAATNEFTSKYLATDSEGDPIDQRAIVQLYMKNIASLPQYSRLSFEQGLQYNAIQESKTHINPPDVPSMDDTHKRRKKKEKQQEKIYTSTDDEEKEISADSIARFGEGFTRFQYKQFEKKYKRLSKSYPNYSSLHEEALVLYVRYRVLEEEAISNGDVDSAEKWGGLANKAATAAKLNPSQIKNDEETTQFSFSEFAASVEKAADVIQVLPRFKYEALDSVDFCIYAIAQWVCGVLGKPCSSYEDIYKFYDNARDEYIEQYGDPYHIFDNDPTVGNRDRVKKFIKVPEDSLANFETNDV